MSEEKRLITFVLCDGPSDRTTIESDHLPRVGDFITWLSNDGHDTTRQATK